MPITPTYGVTVSDDYLTSCGKAYLDEAKASDQVYNYSALIWHLKQKGNTEVKTGGSRVVHQLRYSKNNQAQWYSGTDTLNTTANETLTEAGWSWTNVAAPVHITGNEKRGNRGPQGKEKLLDLMQERLDNATESVRDQLAQALVASSTATGKPDALATIVSATATTGGISGTSYSWWQSTVTASGSFAARGPSDLMTLFTTIQQGPDKPDFIYSNDAEWRYYWAFLQPAMRITNNKTADAGFDNLTFMGSTWVHDSYQTAGTIYMLNTNWIQFCAMAGANVDLNEEVRPANQDAWVRQVLLQCCMTVKQRRKQGKLTGVSA